MGLSRILASWRRKGAVSLPRRASATSRDGATSDGRELALLQALEPYSGASAAHLLSTVCHQLPTVHLPHLTVAFGPVGTDRGHVFASVCGDQWWTRHHPGPGVDLDAFDGAGVKAVLLMPAWADVATVAQELLRRGGRPSSSA